MMEDWKIYALFSRFNTVDILSRKNMDYLMKIDNMVSIVRQNQFPSTFILRLQLLSHSHSPVEPSIIAYEEASLTLISN